MILACAVIGAAIVAVIVSTPWRAPAPSTLRVGLPAPLDRMQPFGPAGIVGLARGLVYPGLMRVEPSGAVMPALAARLEWSPDRRTVRITLRRVELHDGQRLRAPDVVAALRRAPRHLDIAFEGALSAIASIEAEGDDFVTIRLHREVPRLEEMLDAAIAAGPTLAGAGTYRVESAGDTRITLVAVPDGKVGYERIELVGYASTDELWKRLGAGEVDAVPFVSGSGYDALARYPWIRRWRHPSNTAVVLVWSPRTRLAPELQLAVGVAVDRTQLVGALREAALPLMSRAEPEARIVFAPEQAEAITGRPRKEAGRLRLVLGVLPSFAEQEVVLRRLQDDLGRIGIDVVSSPVAQHALGHVFAGEDAHLTMAPVRLPGRAEPTPIDHEVALYRFVVRSAALPSVCGLVSGPRTFLPYLDRAFPCASPEVASP